MEWFENVRRYTALEAEQFAYSLLTRSQRLSHENLRLRDPAYVERFEHWIAGRAFEQAGLAPPPASNGVPPMFTPFKARSTVLKNRIVVSPMAQYSAEHGEVGDYHLMHLGARAMGGAGLVMAEMTCVSADARITPGCPGLYAPEHTDAWKRIVDFVHANSSAAIGIQLGHAGAKGSTRRAWDGIDLPLDEGNWPLVSASRQQYLEGVSQWSREATREDLERIKADFVRSTQAAAAAGFDWLELHCAHGYLLSSFISPLTNFRQDEYGGSLQNRCRYPLEVFRAVRAAWPSHLPISVRVSAHDWVEGGITPGDAVQVARLFREAGADMIDCSSGQVSKQEKPVFGRMFQTPFSDRIRNEAGIPTIAVGAIYEADHANSIIASGRADLCAVARPHLANPAWTLLEAAKIGYAEQPWPRQYRAAKQQLERNLERERQLAASASGLSPQQVAARLLEG
jgi:anthraniloyl-CoA monooxygenase